MASPLDAVRRLSAASVSLLLSRAEFASVELAQARAQLLRWFLFVVGILLLALLGLLFATGLFVIALWPVLGGVALLLPAVLYLSGAIILYRKLQREVADAPPLLSQTLQELSRDRDAFRGRDAGEPAPRAGAEEGQASP